MPRIRVKKLATAVSILVMCYILIFAVTGDTTERFSLSSFSTLDDAEGIPDHHQQQGQQEHTQNVTPGIYALPTIAANSTRDKYNITCTFKHDCWQWFSDSKEENLKKISNYPRAHLLDFPELGTPQTNMTSFPVIVTSSSKKFFGSLQGLLKSVYEFVVPKYKDVKVLLYDMGLTTEQLVQVRKHCGICSVRQFNFHLYPHHVASMKVYAWKPMMIKEALREVNWVWWMDSSARIITSDLDRALQYSIENSILFFTYDQTSNIAKHTDIRTMLHLKEDRCKYRYFGEIEAGFVLYHFDDVTKTVVDSWSACALNERCISPSRVKIMCNPNVQKDGACHRFDQSALSIILRRIFHQCNDYPLVKTPLRIHEIRRGEQIDFFPN